MSIVHSIAPVRSKGSNALQTIVIAVPNSMSQGSNALQTIVIAVPNGTSHQVEAQAYFTHATFSTSP